MIICIICHNQATRHFMGEYLCEDHANGKRSVYLAKENIRHDEIMEFIQKTFEGSKIQAGEVDKDEKQA